MNAYHETLTLPADTIDRLEELCRGPATDCGSDETVFDHEVTFDDGRRMAIQVVAPNDPAESCWTQGVLFEAGGAELGCTEPGDAFAGDYEVCCDGNVYSARVAEDSSGTLLLDGAAELEVLADWLDNFEQPLKAARAADLAFRLRQLSRQLV